MNHPMKPDLETSAAATVLVGMSAQEVAAGNELSRLAHSLDGSVAFLQLGDPSLSAELTRLAETGAEQVLLVGVSLTATAPATSWLRRIAGHWVRENRDVGSAPPEVHVATKSLRAGLTVDALMRTLETTRPVSGQEAGLTSAAWEEVPGYRHQVLLCRGPRCTARGSDHSAEVLKHDLRARGLLDDHVLITQTSCLVPCNHAPVVAVQPDDVWYAHVDADAAARIIDEHLLSGTPAEAHRLPRHPTHPSAPDRD